VCGFIEFVSESNGRSKRNPRAGPTCNSNDRLHAPDAFQTSLWLGEALSLRDARSRLAAARAMAAESTAPSAPAFSPWAHGAPDVWNALSDREGNARFVIKGKKARRSLARFPQEAIAPLAAMRKPLPQTLAAATSCADISVPKCFFSLAGAVLGLEVSTSRQRQNSSDAN
jgi:hypothetical protein